MIPPLPPQLPPGPYSKWERRAIYFLAAIYFATGMIYLAGALKGCAD